MKIQVIASTKVGYSLPKEDAINFSGKSAGICYLPDTLETLFSESLEKTLKRANGNIASGHHSVFGHPTYNLTLEGIPKILAMILNNEQMYNTSEKSARYTHMEPSPEEKELYEKWIEIYYNRIKEVYPNFPDKRIYKLAQENARYLISVFTPATVMEYTVNFCQLNYIINWAREYIESDKNDEFSLKLKEVFKEFLEAMPDLEVEGLDSKVKGRKFSLFATRDREEEFGENYCTTYYGSFAELAQAQRHRTLSYEMSIPSKPSFFVPPIIEEVESLKEEWLKDISSLSKYFPQGMLIKINERGTIEKFILKCMERLCGAAQLEIMRQTRYTLESYLEAVEDRPTLYEYLLPYSAGARCTFPGFKCTAPCIFGGKDALTRII